MSRRARLTVLELGASPVAWAANRWLGTDDWVVVAQQSDEPAREFTERVRQRARRLSKEDTRIESLEVYASPHSDAQSSAARRTVVEEVGDQIAQGGRITLWSACEDPKGDAELAAILAKFGPLLAARQIAMNHQTCDAAEPERLSGVRHSLPGLESEAPHFNRAQSSVSR